MWAEPSATLGDEVYRFQLGSALSNLGVGDPPAMTLVMTGFASRAAIQPPPPRIVSVGGKLPIVDGSSTVDYKKLDTPSGIPIFTTTWSIVYFIDEVPDLQPQAIAVVGGDPNQPTVFNL